MDAPYVRSDAGPLGGVLMVRPSARFDRLPPINGEAYPIAERVREQYDILVRTLRDRGVRTVVLDPNSDSPTQTLVGDCAVLFPKGAVILRPTSIERRGEAAHVEAALTELGVPVIARIAAPGLLDGGDIALAGDRAFVALRKNGSNEVGRRQFEEIAHAHGIRVAELRVTDDVHRLRNVFSFVADDAVVAAPSKVDIVPLTGAQIVEIPLGEEYAAGVLALGPRRVIANLRFRTAVALMRRAKITVEAIDLWEFGKAGVGPFSLVLPLKRG